MKLLASTLAIALFASGAYAQDASSQPDGAASGQNQPAANAQPAASAQVLVEIDNEDAPVPSLNLMAGQVEDMMVIGSDDSEIGEVEDVLGDQNGQPQAIVVEAGGFLGLGEKRIILMLNRISLDMGQLRTTLTENEISELPEYQG